MVQELKDAQLRIKGVRKISTGSNSSDSDSRHSIYIRTVSFKLLLYALLNRFKLVYGLFGQSNIHRTVHSISTQNSMEGITCTKAK